MTSARKPRRIFSSFRGATADLVHDGDVVGRALRTKAGVKPVYVSVGTGITLDEAVKVCLASGAGVRIPEPTRRAHMLVNEVRKRFRPG